MRTPFKPSPSGKLATSSTMLKMRQIAFAPSEYCGAVLHPKTEVATITAARLKRERKLEKRRIK